MRVHGNLSKTIEYVQIGGGDAGQKNFRVSWTQEGTPNGATPIPVNGLVIVGVHGDTTQDIFPAIALKKYVGGVFYGMDWIRFDRLGFEAKGEPHGVIEAGTHGDEFGRLVMFDCTIRRNRDKPNYYGTGMQFGIRIQSPGRYHLERVNCEDSGEYFFYLDDVNVTHGRYIGSEDWKSYFIDCHNNGTSSPGADGFYGGGSVKGFFQFVSRATEWL